MVPAHTRKEEKVVDETTVEVPKYKSHKTVRAAKITEIQNHESDGSGSRTMVFGEIGGSKFLTDEWNERFKPEVGGYYVIYEDGYISYSPAKAFEEGYTKV